MARIDPQPFELLGKMIRPPPPPEPVKDREWFPRLTPAQEELYFADEKFILCHAEKGPGKCRTGDAMIYTTDGLIRLEEMKPASAKFGFTEIHRPVLAFCGTRVIESVAREFWVEESLEALRCEFENGAELTGSPRHPLWVCEEKPSGEYGFIYAGLNEMKAKKEAGYRYWTPQIAHPSWKTTDLVSLEVEMPFTACRLCGNKVLARGLCGRHYSNLVAYQGKEFSRKQGVAIKITENLAYTIGALVGDGMLNVDKAGRGAKFSNLDTECLNRVSAGLAEIGCRLKHARGCDYDILPSARAKPFIRALDLSHLCYRKRIPAQILKGPKRVAASFLSGLFDTDGTVDKSGSICFCTTSQKLGIDVQDLLAAFGIMCSRRRRKTASGKPTWNLSLNGRAAFDFGREIGFTVSRKHLRIAKPKISFRCPSGFNQNRYGYPGPIKKAMRLAWDRWQVPKTNKLCDKLKRFQSFKSVPSREKVQQIIQIFGNAELFSPFLLSNHWLEVSAIEPCRAELFDISVPGPCSFLASGTINHNTWGVLNKLVKHCYLNENALALIVVTVRSMANKGGAWSKLQENILPTWRDGNRDRDGRLLDEGMGLHYTDVKFDSQHNELIWIQNQYDTWCCVVMVSAPHASQLRLRIRGYEPSFVFVDELTSCDSPIYFTSIAAQLGRRLYITGPQQYVAATNPDDPEHWVFKKFFVEPFDEETGEWSKDYRTIYFPISENIENLVVGYHEGLKGIYKHDPIEALRMVAGEWVARPSGDALFGDMFNPAVHMRPLDDEGKPDPKKRLLMNPGYPLIVGIDPGGANNAFSFMQFLPVDGRFRWVIFDEIVTIRKKINYLDLIPVVMRRIKWWRDTVQATPEKNPQVWISDNSAFNQFRAGGGSYDVLDFERIYEANRVKIGLEPLGKIKACPKFNGSDIAQTQIGQRLLAAEEIIVSSGCPKTHRMFLQLDSTKQKEGEPFDPTAALTPRRSDWLHIWKANAYVFLYASINPTALVPSPTSSQQLIRVA